MPSSPEQYKPRHHKPGQRSLAAQDYWKWYNTAGWKRLRSRHLQEHPYCVQCLSEGKSKAAAITNRPHVDHVTPHRGDKELFFDPNNLQTLCPRHHSQKTKRGE